LIVVDTSAAVELVLLTRLSDAVAARLATEEQAIHVPHLYDLEVAHVLRRLVQLREVSPTRAQEALEDATLIPQERHAHVDLLPRIWALRTTMTAYDAAFVALAEALDATLVTCDAKLARAAGHYVRLELVRA
jgi:predicted nucleic acid-binding protein